MFFYTSPLEQFEIMPLFSFIFTNRIFAFTNESLFLFIIFRLFIISLHLSFMHKHIIPSRWQSLWEELIYFTHDLVTKNIGIKHLVFFPWIFFLFHFILWSNLIRMIPYSFTTTSHIIITFSLALALFIGINIIRIYKHRFRFLEFFLPAGAPLLAAPFFVAIELISYFARVFSLSIRLFANLMSGHALLKILAGFAWTMLRSRILFAIVAILPIRIIIAVTMLELCIAFLQAYVFAILICLYLHDVIALSH